MVNRVPLAEIINTEEKTVSQIIHDGVSKRGLDEVVFGMREVKDNLEAALFKASFLSEHNYVPIILLRGPSAGGKSELIKGLKRVFYNSVREKKSSEKLYTLVIDGQACPYKENAFNLFRSELPFDLPIAKRCSIASKSGQEICPDCLKNLAEVASCHDLKEYFESSKSRTDSSIEKDDLSEKRIMLEEVVPQLSNIDLADPKFEERFYSVVKNANRGILLISADKSRLSDLELNNYQFLINLYDNNTFDKDGKKIPLDLLVIIHSNENFLDDERILGDDEADESRPLKERIIEVKVRRNLSYSQEERIYVSSKLPINRQVPDALKYLSKMNVISRLSSSIIDDKAPLALDTLLEVLDMYDSGTLTKINTFSKSTEKFLQSTLPNEIELNEKIKKLIFENGAYISGWSQGLSPRLIKDLLNGDSTHGKKDLNFFDIIEFYDNNMESIPTSSREQIREYISGLISSDIRTNLEYGILSLMLKYEDVPFKEYITNLEKYLVSEEPEKLLPTLGKLQDLVDIPALKEMTKQYIDYKEPENKKPVVDLKQLLKFAYRYEDREFHFLKGEDVSREQLKDNKSKLYVSLKELSIKEYGYWDKSFEQALSIYLDGVPE